MVESPEEHREWPGCVSQVGIFISNHEAKRRIESVRVVVVVGVVPETRSYHEASFFKEGSGHRVLIDMRVVSQGAQQISSLAVNEFRLSLQLAAEHKMILGAAVKLQFRFKESYPTFFQGPACRPVYP
jgi:hypothetical protein